MIDYNATKLKFKEIISNTVHRDGIDRLMDWLESTDFYTAPASARSHGAESCGLCAHSIGVYTALKAMQTTESDETISIVSLFHDLCKVNFYKMSMRNTKDDSGKWIKVPYHEYRQDDPLPVGHGEKSVILLMKYIDLTDEEILAIRWHMGGYYTSNPGESQAIGQALSKSHLVLKLQTADQTSAFWNNI